MVPPERVKKLVLVVSTSSPFAMCEKINKVIRCLASGNL